MALFARVMTLPVPTVCALGGHAFGAGFMVALCHDVRIMRADRGFLCANEIEIGMSIPEPELALFRHKLSMSAFHQTVILAKRWGGQEALDAGVVQQLAEAEGNLAALEQTLAVFESRKGAQIAVLMLPTTQPETIEQYAVRVEESWKLGRKGVDDGVLLVIAFVGTLNPSGGDVSVFLPLEQSLLPSCVADTDRTALFARYAFGASCFAAVGSALAGAPEALVGHVRKVLSPHSGEHLLDLYSGVGLFAGLLASDLGPTGQIDAVEVSVQACSDARRNLHDLPSVRIHQSAVDSWLAANEDLRPNIVVLDPPRGGAGKRVIESILALRPRAVAYVACDPAALGRDLGYVRAQGWQVSSVQGFDLFPMTHHMEAVALLVPA